MALFSIADLHLPGKEGEKKSMEVFGPRWIGGNDKLKKNWNAIIRSDDTVIIPGDISWAMTLEEAYNDFSMLNSLPGVKIIGKGNHDFWWTTATKMNKFFNDNHFDSLKILYNNSFAIGNVLICGSRGWFAEESNQKTIGDVSWTKITARETMRLKMSLESNNSTGMERIVFLHFPPVWGNSVCNDIIELLHTQNVTKCYYGHIHGMYSSEANFVYEGIRFELISADYLDFCPKKIIP